VGLPPDDRPRTEPVDAFEEFAGLTSQSSFEGLVGEVVAQIERRRPEPEFPEGPTGTEVAWGHSDEERIIIVRRGTFGDDSVAGAEYTVGAQQSGDGWCVGGPLCLSRRLRVGALPRRQRSRAEAIIGPRTWLESMATIGPT
jgi:hypothetical protein